MRLSALDALARGLHSLRANWELALALAVQNLLVSAFAILALLPLALTLGLGDVNDLVGDPWGVGQELAGRIQAQLRSPGVWDAPLVAAVGGAFFVAAMALVVIAFFQAGTFGVLVAADRQSPPGRPRGWQWFRTFSVAHLLGWGGRHLGRTCGLLLIGLVAGAAEGALLLVLVAASGLGGRAWGGGAALGIGCGGLLPVLFLMWLTFAWSGLALAAAGAEGATIGRAARQALTVLGRRFGTLLMLTLLLVIVALLLGGGSIFGTFLVDVSAGSTPAESSAAVPNALRLLLGGLELLLNGLVGVAWAATLVALVGGELAPPAAARPSSPGRPRA